MDEARELLKILTEKVPPDLQRKHSLTLHDGLLRVTLAAREKFYYFGLEDADLDKSPEMLATEIIAMFSELA